MTEDEVQELRLESDRLRCTLESIADAVITIDTGGRITFLNGVAERLTKWAASDAIGSPLDAVFRVVDAGTKQPVEISTLRALRSGSASGRASDTLLIARDGSGVPIEESSAPMRDPQGGISGIVIVFRDVTERRRAESALRESEERFRLLVEGVLDYALFLLDADGIVVSWNAGAERITGYRANEIIGRHFSFFYPPDRFAAGWPAHELRRARDTGRFEDEGWRVRKDGSMFWANTVITALHDDQGRLRGFAKVTRDLTQKRELDRARARGEALLELDRRKDELLALLSSELRSPLAPIVNAMQMLRLDSGDPMRTLAITMVERQVGHLSRLIDDLLDVSSIATGRIRLRRERVDARTLVSAAAESARPLMEERGHELVVAVPEEPVWLDVDRQRVGQVLASLLANAAKHSGESCHVAIALEPADQEAIVRVHDDGAGIPAPLLPLVFDPFTKGMPSAQQEGGLGVGLTIARRLVELHGGTVDAHSAGRGKGSEFVVRLPLSREAGSTAAAVMR
jgi:PAS domain S-box-containing protein